MANSLANNFWIVPRLFQYSGVLSRYCLTAGIFAQIGWTTHEHEITLPSTATLGQNVPKWLATRNGSRRRHWDTTARRCIVPMRNEH